jgi:hypothetical protein
MQEFIDHLIKQADLSPEQASKVAESVKSFVSDRLPEPVRSAALAAISGENVEKIAEQAKGLLGNLASRLL